MKTMDSLKLQSELFKEAKKVLKKTKREALQNIVYNTDGTIQFTDGVRLMNITDFHENTEKRTFINAITGLPENNDVQYPILDKILENVERDTNGTVSMDVHKVLCLLEFFKKENHVMIEFDKNTMKVSGKTDMFTSTLNVKEQTEDYYNVAFNPSLMIDVLKFFKRLKVKTVNFNYTGMYRPHSFTYENITYILTPCRIPN